MGILKFLVTVVSIYVHTSREHVSLGSHCLRNCVMIAHAMYIYQCTHVYNNISTLLYGYDYYYMDFDNACDWGEAKAEGL